MNIIIDSNILFSALIKESMTRKIIFEYDGLFLFPSFIFEEIEKHKKELFEKSEMGEEDFNKLLELILKKVKIVSSEELYPYKKEAMEIVREVDLDDVTFIACALAYPTSIIWSDDKKLKSLTKVKVLNTREILKALK